MLYVQRWRRGIINHVVCAAVEWRNYKLCCMCSGGGAVVEDGGDSSELNKSMVLNNEYNIKVYSNL